MSMPLLVLMICFVILGIIAIIYAYTPIVKDIIRKIKEKHNK